jgi:hypothetical protein
LGLFDSVRKTVKWGKQETVDRASKGVVSDYGYYGSYSTNVTDAKSPNTSISVLLDMYEKDPVVNTAVTKRVNAILDSGFTVESDSQASKDSAKKLLEELGFNYRFLRKLFLNASLYRHVFIEIVRTPDGKAKEVHILNTPEMEVKYDRHGEISGYEQRAGSGEVVSWTAEDVIYVPFDQVTNSVWGVSDLKTLYRTVTTKNFIEEFLNNLAVGNSWRQLVKTTMPDDRIREFMAYYRSAQADPMMPLVIQVPPNSEKESTDFSIMRDPKDLKEFLGLLDYLRAQMLMQLKVPPILMGLPDNSNRSNSDDQMKAFYMDMNADRIIMQDVFNTDLFKNIGLESVKFSWNPINKRTEKEDVEMAEKLMNMGAKPDQVEAFLRMAGLELPDGKIFEEREELEMTTPDDAASRPSRARKAEDSPSKKIGTGSDSSTRDEQMGD